MRQKTFLYVLLSLVIFTWMVNFIAPIFIASYSPPPELNGGFTGMAAVLVGAIAKANDKNNGSGTGTGTGTS